jgi:hypothetical protein
MPLTTSEPPPLLETEATEVYRFSRLSFGQGEVTRPTVFGVRD